VQRVTRHQGLSFVRTLYTLAYPSISAADSEFISSIRAVHDLQFKSIVEPHFTMVFGINSVPEAEYKAHVHSVAQQSSPVSFVCRYAMLGADDQDETGYVYLVPDEGYSSLSVLHDRLYSGPLESCLRLDREYVPHITIGRLSDRGAAKALCTRLNARGVHVQGAVRGLSVGAIENGRVTNLAELPLQG
jgi:2'-5' RNA ligase